MNNTMTVDPFLKKIRKGGLTIGSLAFLAAFYSCQTSQDHPTITVKNPSDIARKAATVEVSAETVKEYIEKYGQEKLVVENAEGSTLVNQWIDYDGDEQADLWLFQVDLAAGASESFTVRPLEEGEKQPISELTTFSRFVPERTDDYTWENDRVAFRTYGPDAQRRIEENQPGGTLSSGIDAWLKSVSYPIIDKWYKENDEKQGAYHIDKGEGYDPYHVGSSRGIGGIGIWENDSLYTSRNFVRYKRIAVGPIRTLFELSYAPWDVNGKQVSETKRISLDLGSNMAKFVSVLESTETIPNATIGITLHEKEGEVMVNEQEGFFRYWEPMDGNQLGLGVVLHPESIQGHKDHRVDYKDGSQLLIMASPKAGEITYYAGFAWDKSGQFADKAAWDNYLEQFAKSVQSPLEVSVQ
ncbi:hypothetical protein GCM10028791_35720 [Echinicola sediminis]